MIHVFMSMLKRRFVEWNGVLRSADSVSHYRNALNIVKDDLIAQVDELTGQMEILKGELQHSRNQRQEVAEKVTTLEEEIKEVCYQSPMNK